MGEWDAQAILTESDAWHWTPPDAITVQTDEVHFYVKDMAATVIRAEHPTCRGATGDTEKLIRRVADLARRQGADRLHWDVGPRTQPADLADVLTKLGGEATATLDICAYDLTRGAPDIPVPGDVTARPVANRQDLRDMLIASALAWGRDAPTDHEIERQSATLESDEPGYFVAFHAGQPAGGGGYTRAGKVARLWGAGVAPAFRGRGVYRGLLAARIDDAVARGLTLALVHANVTTSAPILRRLGFTAYGRRRIYTLLIR